MRQIITLFSITILCIQFLYSQSYDALLTDFKNPPAKYGPLPFFWWTGEKLSVERMGEELDQLKSAGFAGVNINYTHTVAGYTYRGNPPLFSDEWWKFWESIVEECKKREMTIGFDDYLVTHGSPELATIGSKIYREVPGISGLLLRQKNEIVSGNSEYSLQTFNKNDIVDVVAYRMKNDQIIPEDPVNLLTIKNSGKNIWLVPEGKWYISILYTELQPYGSMNPLYAEKVIEYYFDKFEKHSKGLLGKNVNYFFQDELTFGGSMPYWSSDFLEKFKKDKNYDLKGELSALFADIGPRTIKIRLDYYDMVTKYMEDSYFKPIFEWCEKRNVIYGHDQIARANAIEGVQYYGDYFRTLRWYHAPGTDRMPELLRGKVVSSISQLYNRLRTWMEAYHSEGWGVIPENIAKWDYEAIIYGYNLISYHSCYYTTLGGWWEWAPGDITFRQPYWTYFTDHYKGVKRLCYLLSQGKHKCDVAILFPTSNIQGDMTGTVPGNSAIESKKLLGIGDSLFKKHSIDFDFLDDHSTQNSRIKNGCLEVAGGSYKILILPEIRNIRSSTMEKILEFYRGGGKVIALSAIPEASDRNGKNDVILDNNVKEIFGAASSDVLTLDTLLNKNENNGIGYYVKSGFDSERIANFISRSIKRDFISKDKNIFVMHRRINDLDIYALYNTKSDSIKTKLSFNIQGKYPEGWNPKTGEADMAYISDFRNDYTEITAFFAPNEFKVIVFGDKKKSEKPISQNKETTNLKKIELDSIWKIKMEPLLNNRWGDFRSPAGNEFISPVTKKFRYKEQFKVQDSIQYTLPSYSDLSWSEVYSSFGPKLWLLGPIMADSKDASIEEKIIKSEIIDPQKPVVIDNKTLFWIPVYHSLRWGILNDPVLTNQTGYAIHGPIGYVPKEIIHLKTTNEGEKWYAWTSINGINNEKTKIAIGTRAGYNLYFNGKDILNRDEVQPQQNVDPFGLSFYKYSTRVSDIQLQKGVNNIMLKIRTAGANSYSRVFMGLDNSFVDLPEKKLNEDPTGNADYVPDSFVASEFYTKPGKYNFDIYPDNKPSFLWYRFETPPGITGLTITAHGSVNLWINGDKMKIEKEVASTSVAARYEQAQIYKVKFNKTIRMKSVAVIRIEPVAGFYGGAALPEPVNYTFSEGETFLCDWSKLGLDSYSGAMTYSKNFNINRSHSVGESYLNLGEVACAAKVWINDEYAGSCYMKPYRLNITKYLRNGENNIRISIANTLANHYSIGMPGGKRYIRDGQLRSGLLGPVSIEFEDIKGINIK